MRILHSAAALAAGACLLLSGCQSVTYQQMTQSPKTVSKAQLCRTLVETQDAMLAQLVVAELSRRRIDAQLCPIMVQQQNAAAATVAAIALTGAAVAVCSGGGCAPRYPAGRGYQGNCEYAWQRDAAGNRCGRRSADDRAGGWEP